MGGQSSYWNRALYHTGYQIEPWRRIYVSAISVIRGWGDALPLLPSHPVQQQYLVLTESLKY